MTQNQENIHFRAASKATHAGVEMLKGEREIPRIVIERIEFVENASINGRTEKSMWIAHFQAGNGWTDLPMVLNQTNCRRITKLYPDCDGYIARLKNVAVRLTSEPCKDPNGGGQTVGLRISQIPAASEQEMKKWMVDHGYAKPAKKKQLTADKVDSCVKWMRDNGKTLDDVKEIYELSQEIEDAIIDASRAVEDLPE